jgi:hypothetical protein
LKKKVINGEKQLKKSTKRKTAMKIKKKQRKLKFEEVSYELNFLSNSPKHIFSFTWSISFLLKYKFSLLEAHPI